jgi:ubiquinone/menaquinone biosynthesis C-methylase UbiE
MTEFTGERVIPGEVNADLWSEHIARYAFARLYAHGRVLDAGCGTGYGSAELAQAASSVIGIDIAPGAIRYARANYPLSQLQFLQSSVTAIPFPKNTFDDIVAFEVIEHLEDHRAFLEESARVIKPQGLLIVSSPNKRYYAESRAETGPNPFHVHEFQRAEFEEELHKVFSNVRIILQDCATSFAFHPAREFWPVEARIGGLGGDPETSNFLIGMCSFGPLPDPKAFVYVPKAANILREREQHIRLLQTQLAQVYAWLSETQVERDSLIELFRKQSEELDARHRWAQDLANQLEAKAHRVVELQDAFAAEQQAAAESATAYNTKIVELEDESRARYEWGVATETRLTAALDVKCQELAECVRFLETAEATVHERTLWAQRTEEQRQYLAAQLNLLRASRWLKLGRKLNLGPVLDQS